MEEPMGNGREQWSEPVDQGGRTSPTDELLGIQEVKCALLFAR